MPFADANTSEKPGAIVPHKRSNPFGTPGFVRGLPGNWLSYRDGGSLIMMQSNPIELYLDVSANVSLLGTLLKEAFCSSKLALLVGSAISQFAPANIPLAADISSNLRALVVDRFSRYAPRDDVKWGIDRLPFEILMSRLVEFAGLDIAEEFISKLITTRKPNPVHLQIGRLIDKCVAQGIDLTVVTTNYDLGIEYGSRSKLKPVIEENDIRKNNNGVCLFKPHGSLGIKGSLVLDAEREYRLVHLGINEALE